MVRIMAAHGIPYAATASVAHSVDLMRKLRRAVETDGPTYLHILTPCNYRWGFPESQSIELARLAVETRFAPLYEVEEGTKLKLQYRTKPQKPVAEYLSAQGRFRHLFTDDKPHPVVEMMQREVDENWASLERWATQ
jgi:pyruvate ferredoxin oxidoreductase beta subunit